MENETPTQETRKEQPARREEMAPKPKSKSDNTRSCKGAGYAWKSTQKIILYEANGDLGNNSSMARGVEARTWQAGK